MITKKIKIQLKNGLEARPVAVLVQVASQYDSRIYVECENKKVNAKSIMGLMSLGLSAGEEVVVSIDGDAETNAIDEIEKYLSAAQASWTYQTYYLGNTKGKVLTLPFCIFYIVFRMPCKEAAG